jgi:hypothetical protein
MTEAVAIHSWHSNAPGRTTIALAAGRYAIATNVTGDDLRVEDAAGKAVRLGPGTFEVEAAGEVTVDYGQVPRCIALFVVSP